ncbi:glycosyltransferase family 4 protein [Peribacillus sp. TH24]|uniref:glycosyltransferase family 4 protein n=1 Tax=Peribacillus sp. TH24 TaxID=2798483 RepID=UPI00191471C5|nr:glycosyltransferase [Peribacillus sp. TH24]MBK5442696.1 glycosyltransferase family 4 protein [Peribacillus sp. TH24]
MKILWLINIPLPEASSLMNEKSSPYGGWLINASNYLADQEALELTVAFPKNGVTESIKLEGNKITYYAFKPVKDRDKEVIEENLIFKKILNEVNPDLVHIYGTELAHTLSMINVCEKEKVNAVISIQGLVSYIEKHMYANLPYRVVYGTTLRNLLRKDNVAGLQKLFYKRGKNEIQAIKNVNHIIGRTTWDKACTSQINQDAEYHFCNETLREEFYKYEWNIEKCEKHSIFLSQGQYPIKGLHYMLEAMPLILREFPNAKVYISGKDITMSETLKDRLLITHYGKYIKKLIRNNKLEENVVFTGPLNEKKMCERYLNSNVFVCPSSIENSPNSLGEAMILGVPCVASDVGGVSDMLKHKEEGFVYQADASYMLAHYVCEIFKNDELALEFSDKSRSHALKTHDPISNTKKLMTIYEDILEK